MLARARQSSLLRTRTSYAAGGMEEDIHRQFADLPLVLQQAVGTAALRCMQQQQQNAEQPRMDIAAVRGSCRPLRDGVDAARTRLKVTLLVQPGEQQLQMLPMAVDAARFRGLRRLDIDLRTGPDQPQGTRSSVHLEGPPAWLQQLQITGCYQIKLLFLPPAASITQLRTLVLVGARLPPSLDCAQFQHLQHLQLINCHDLRHLSNLASCSSLRVLDIGCFDKVGGLESSVLSQLQQLEQLVVCDRSVSELDVTAVSPSLTHLDVGNVATVDLALPGGAPRTALRYLGLHRASQPRSWDLRAVPNLETLDVKEHTQLPPLLDLSGVPHLKRLVATSANLKAVGLSAARASLVSLRLLDTPLQTLDLTGCIALRELYCMCQCLRSLDLTPAGASLTHFSAWACRQLTSIDLAGCTALQELLVKRSTALTQLDLSACCSLHRLNVAGSGVDEVDVGSCTGLRRVVIHEGQRVVGAGPDVQVSMSREL